MSKVAERFLKYVSFDTQSKDEEEQVPSTEKQLVLAKELVKELEEMGASDETKISITTCSCNNNFSDGVRHFQPEGGRDNYGRSDTGGQSGDGEGGDNRGG